MKHFLLPALALLLLVGCTATDSNISPEEPNTVITNNDGNVNGSVVIEETAQNEINDNWVQLFDGKTMTGWTVPTFGDDGDVDVKDGTIVIGQGDSITGIRYNKEFPKVEYEIRYEARRTGGGDFFGACTFPVKESYCTFVNSGWGGAITGLSSIDGSDASENSFSTYFEYKDNTWYQFRIRITNKMIQVWITPQDKEGNWEAEQSVIELETDDRTLSTRYEMDKYKPLGFCTYATEGQLRNIEYRKVVEQ